jgi:putative CocE/NonD family hydrolase
MQRTVRTIRHAWIPMSDGCRLAARIWLPEDAEEDPVPGILEYIPYRKNDATASRDARIHPYFAMHGYAAVRVDMRGSGDSDGILLGEYLQQEQDDALEVIAWIAQQPWCTGKVGMIGKSWGGFNGLQVAALRPPALAAIITVASTDDRYADDVHYIGGAVLASDMLPWATTMLAYNGRPPDPEAVGEGWRATWLDRLERTPPYAAEWLAHQRRDEFWRHGSVCEDFGAIECAVFAVGGWADGYTSAIPRMLEGLRCPRKGLVGPWAHLYPHDGVPGPAIGFMQEAVRWWDHWLKGADTGVMDEPMLRSWLQDAVPPRTEYHERPGRWVADPSWPSPNVEAAVTPLPGLDGPVRVSAPQTTGLDSGLWLAWGGAGDAPPDQRADDGRSVSFTGEPLAERVEILGFPEVELTLASDRPNALVAVRLCDVAPDGASTLVTRGILNLTHRESHAEPAPLEPGRRCTVKVPLKAVGYAFPPGHRIRVSVSQTYWPMAWPSPEAVTLTLHAGSVSLPVRRPSAADEQLRPFGPVEAGEDVPVELLRAPGGRSSRSLGRDYVTGEAVLTAAPDFFPSVRFLDTGLEYAEQHSDEFRIVEHDPLSAAVRCAWMIEIGRGDWRTRVEARSAMTSDRDSFLVTSSLEAYEGSVRVFARTWTSTIPRDLV